MKTILLHPAPDSCASEFPALTKSGYIDGQIVSAVLDLARFLTFEDWMRHVTRDHGKGWHCSLRRAEKAGLVVERIMPQNYRADWTAVDLSKPTRQGRSMSPHYQRTLAERGGEPTEWMEHAPIACPAHWRMVLGCLAPAEPRTIAGKLVTKRLVAYLSLIRDADLVVCSSLLAHNDWMREGAMPSLFVYLMSILKAPQDERANPAVRGVRAAMYAGWNDGSEGLRHWKGRCGFEGARLVTS